MVGFVEVSGHYSVGFVGYIVEVVCKSSFNGVASLSHIYEFACYALYGIDKVVATTVYVDFGVPTSVVKWGHNTA